MSERLSDAEIKAYQDELKYQDEKHPHRKDTTVEKIRGSVSNASGIIGSKINAFRTNPNVQKAGRFVRDRAEIFQQNMAHSAGERQQKEPPLSPSRAPHKSTKQKKHNQPRAPPQPATQPQNNDPFGINKGGRKPPGRGHNPFGI